MSVAHRLPSGHWVESFKGRMSRSITLLAASFFVATFFSPQSAESGVLRLDFSSDLHRSTGQFTSEYVTTIDGWLTFDPTVQLISSTDGGIGRGSSRAPLIAVEFNTLGSTFRNTGGQVGDVLVESDATYCMVDGISCYRDMVKFWVWDPQPDPMTGVAVTGFSLEIFGGSDMLEDGDRQPSDLSFLSRARYARILLTKEGGPHGLSLGSHAQANVIPHMASVSEPSSAPLASLALVLLAIRSRKLQLRVKRHPELSPGK